MEVKVIAHIRTPFPDKFGVPRQSGLCDVPAQVVFEKEYRVAEAFRGLEDFSHLWLLWEFDKAERSDWSPTVRPPRLGGNTRMGVFATRSPFRPNAIGLSAVKLEGIEYSAKDGPVLHISGADLMDGTPILDVKPYLAYADSIPRAAGGFTSGLSNQPLTVDFPQALLEKLPEVLREGAVQVLACDPRPRYQSDPKRVYGMAYGGFDIRFTVAGENLTVAEVKKSDC
jgi:tRNA-Thr(GGU) m(6)t(6)A37 methyltransferase TsaA